MSSNIFKKGWGIRRGSTAAAEAEKAAAAAALLAEQDQDVVLVASADENRFIRQVLLGAGVPDDHARLLASALTSADVRAQYNFGLLSLPNLLESMFRERIDARATPTVTIDAPALAHVDAGHALGEVSGLFCMRLAIQKAATCGIGIVFCRGYVDIGFPPWYTEMAADQNMIGLCFSTIHDRIPDSARTVAGEPELACSRVGASAPASNANELEMHMSWKLALPPQKTVGRRDMEARLLKPLDMASLPTPMRPPPGSNGHNQLRGLLLGLLVDGLCGCLGGLKYKTPLSDAKSTKEAPGPMAQGPVAPMAPVTPIASKTPLASSVEASEASVGAAYWSSKSSPGGSTVAEDWMSWEGMSLESQDLDSDSPTLSSSSTSIPPYRPLEDTISAPIGVRWDESDTSVFVSYSAPEIRQTLSSSLSSTPSSLDSVPHHSNVLQQEEEKKHGEATTEPSLDTVSSSASLASTLYSLASLDPPGAARKWRYGISPSPAPQQASEARRLRKRAEQAVAITIANMSPAPKIVSMPTECLSETSLVSTPSESTNETIYSTPTKEFGPPAEEEGEVAHCFIALNPDAVLPNYASRLGYFFRYLTSQEPMNPTQPVLVPGDFERANILRTLREGGVRFMLPDIEKLNTMSKKMGVRPLKYKACAQIEDM